MKKTNKKGFTLVELLAVIVILGVLLLIAVPSVQNIIKSSKKRSFESATKLAVENVETMASTEKIDATLEPCYIPISQITLERGNFGDNVHGYVDVDGNGKATITISNNSFSGTGDIDSFNFDATLEQKVDQSDKTYPKDGTDTKVGVCSWWEK